MKIFSNAIPALILTAVFVTSAEAHPRGGPAGIFGGGPGADFPGPALMLEHMADHLDLTDEQRDRVTNILEAARPEIEALRKRFQANREALMTLEAGEPAYAAELDNLAMSNGQLATEGTLLFARVRTEVHAVLTDEQLEKLERSKKRMRAAFGNRREHH